MTEAQIEKYVSVRPFQPFRLLLDTGEQMTVRKPRKALLSGKWVALEGICRQTGGAGVEKFRIVPVNRIVSAEWVVSEKT